MIENLEKIKERWNFGKAHIIVSKDPTADLIEAVGHIDQLVAEVSQQYYALRQVVNMLGPEILVCKEDHCDGLIAEAHEALQIAKEALETP